MYYYKLVVQPDHINNSLSYVFLHAAEKNIPETPEQYLSQLIKSRFSNGSFAYLIAISEEDYEELKQTMLEI
ncbi:hypothetical protein [Niabella aurantiaca]|uniref:hypothetical protein n=1 Tax=Niabella aurantiaca TaxID=379900 RepID=UPI0003618B4C|nr:hypothetical protein [Niabella aurantiaca]